MTDPSRSSIKRDASPNASSSSEKRPKFSLPGDELNVLSRAQLEKEMKLVSRELIWREVIEKAGDQDSVWWCLYPRVLMELLTAMANTTMGGTVIPCPNLAGAQTILSGFTKTELEQWKDGLRNGIENDDWIELAMHPKLRVEKVPSTVAMERRASDPQEEATMGSWDADYFGQAAEALWDHIVKHYDPNSQVYAQFCAVIQSSGKGKSRATDELGKKHFIIPLNLRDRNSSGFPPADHAVRDFLMIKGTEAASYWRISCFFAALFSHTLETLKGFDSKNGIEEVAREFRNSMTAGQSFSEHNHFRRAFYEEVIKLANEKAVQGGKREHGRISSLPSKDMPLQYASTSSTDIQTGYAVPAAASCRKLVEFLKSKDLSPNQKRTPNARGQVLKEAPFIVLAFDEAHVLTNSESGRSFSNFSVMRRVLRGLVVFPVFSLFLSTTGKIAQVKDESKIIVHGPFKSIPPFTELGFDTFASKVSLDGGVDLEQLTHDSHIARLGRPLFALRYMFGDASVKQDIVTFAIAKLLNDDPNVQRFTKHQELACLSQRLPIGCNSTAYISQTAEMKQVEGHLRVCLKADAAFESIETVSSSEPILSEAAYAIMTREAFDPVQAFKSIFEGFALHKGDRGEFLVALLLTMARDQAVGRPCKNRRPERRFFSVVPFICGSLFKPSEDFPEEAASLKMLEADFPDATMHFNHILKVREFKSFNKKSLLLLMTRGAAVMCATNQPSIDTINVFLKSGTKVSVDNLGIILCQSQNDSVYTHNTQPKLFESMDPYTLGILETNQDKPVPVIKIFFALAAKSAGIRVTRRPPSPAYDAVIYEIWVSGLSSDFLMPVKAEQTNIWEGLLQASYGWKDIYKTETDAARDLRRSMNPGAAQDDGHWSHWAKPSAAAK
ncbi:hypothetical protein M413DRAFT_22158 [Hebeloma cylindrosporum]|uniref:Uncharacterized protein n=1 Tax=Hebeloma cylindrosporum TaxID=76867 RepID=A0A0C3CTS3_HEBCY|nr:hypothetical protein M413DRAFT_22158 [Hebeloma cylindrosporum h7]